MADAWIVIANRSQGRICRAQTPRADLESVTEIEHPQGRRSRADLVTGDRGRMVDPGTGHRSAMEPSTDPKDHEADVLARRLTVYLEKARNDSRFDRLWLFAEPDMLGRLRQAFSSPLQALVRDEVPKNLTSVPIHDLRRHLPDKL